VFEPEFEKLQMKFAPDRAVEPDTWSAEAALPDRRIEKRRFELLFIRSAIRAEPRFAPEFAWNFRLTAPWAGTIVALSGKLWEIVE